MYLEDKDIIYDDLSTNFPLLPPIDKIMGSLGRLKILNILTIENELNVTAISRKTGLNHTRVKIHLQELQEYDIVQEKRFGRIRIFKINVDEEGGYKIKNFLRSWNTIQSNSSIFP